jgi:hypothetical protein
MGKVSRLNVLLFLFCFSFCAVPATLVGQATISVSLSRDTAAIGDQLDVFYKIKVPAEARVVDLDFSPLDSIKNLVYSEDNEALDKVLDWQGSFTAPKVSFDNGKVVSLDKIESSIEGSSSVYSFTQKISVFSIGIFDFPSPVLQVSEDLRILPLEKPRLVVTYPNSLVEKDSLELNPIKPIIETTVALEDFLPYIFGLILLLLLAYISKKLFKKKEIELTEEEPIEKVFVPAHVIALRGLEQLKKERLWEVGKIKQYQSRLTDIIRKYLEDRFDVKAMEMTTDEISYALEKTQFDANHESKLREILQIADLIKFAKAEPELSIHERFLDDAIQFVKDTKLDIHTEGE